MWRLFETNAVQLVRLEETISHFPIGRTSNLGNCDGTPKSNVQRNMQRQWSGVASISPSLDATVAPVWSSMPSKQIQWRRHEAMAPECNQNGTELFGTELHCLHISQMTLQRATMLWCRPLLHWELKSKQNTNQFQKACNWHCEALQEIAHCHTHWDAILHLLCLNSNSYPLWHTSDMGWNPLQSAPPTFLKCRE